MNLNSKYFDSIRINPGGTPIEGDQGPRCEWNGCARQGTHRAPKGRRHEGEFFRFCLEHVREYNKSYNYFAGMPDDDIAAYQRSAATGHRPTWTIGVDKPTAAGRAEWADAFIDHFGLFSGGNRQKTADSQPQRRPLKNLERRSFDALDLEGWEQPGEIKARYKTLVKRLHPDANGGDRSSEDRLRQIIQAYHYLKSSGFC